MKHSAGFTLIELIVVISLITILSGVAVPRLTSFSRSQNLEQAALDFESSLYKARSLSMDSVTNEAGEKVDWGILVLSNNAYALGQRDSDSADVLAVKKSYNLPDNVTISPSGGPTQSVFERLSGRCVEGARTYTFTESEGSSVSVTIYDNGRVGHQ